MPLLALHAGQGGGCRELAQMFWNQAGDDAFIAGLLQEIGILVLVQELGEPYVDFLNGVRRQGEDLTALEMATLGFDHAILSARLLDHWNLPTHLVDAVAAPHDAELLSHWDEDRRRLPRILHLASLMASILVDGRHALMAELMQRGADYREITVERLDALLDQLQRHVEMMADVFALRIDQPQSYREILFAAHRQMANAAVDALPDMLRAHDRMGPQREALQEALSQFTHGPAVPPAAARPPAQGPPSTQSYPDASADPGLHGRLLAAMEACRARQRELSLALLEVDNYERMIVLHGPERMGHVVELMPRAVESLADIDCQSLVVADSQCAVVLPDCDRRQACELTCALLSRLPAWLTERGELSGPVSCSAGVATLARPWRGAGPQDLIAAADRCLFAARASGGRVVKSIDLL